MVPSSLDDFVTTAVSLSANGKLPELCEFLNKSTSLLSTESANLDTLLETFNLTNHTMVIMMILYVKLSSFNPNTQSSEVLYKQLNDFSANAVVEHINHVPDTFIDVFQVYANLMISMQKPGTAIHAVNNAIEKLQDMPGQLTSLHADLCKLCLLAKNFKPALALVDKDIHSFKKENNKSEFNSKAFLLYYYYGGLVYAAVKRYDRALYFFEVLLITPCLKISNIVLEGYKKYILISLIMDGGSVTLPKNANQIIGRFVRPLCQAYTDLATACEDTTMGLVQKCVIKHMSVYTREQNYGLVKQVIHAMQKRNIQKLTETFHTLTLADLKRRSTLNENDSIEKYLLEMVQDNQIFASIDKSKDMVEFRDDLEEFNNVETLENFEQMVGKLADLDSVILRIENQITKSPDFLKKFFGNQDEETPPKMKSFKTTFTV